MYNSVGMLQYVMTVWCWWQGGWYR